MLGSSYEKASIVLFICDETLTAASFNPDDRVPDKIFSLPFDPDDEESFARVRSKLLSFCDLENFEPIPDVLVAGDIFEILMVFLSLITIGKRQMIPRLNSIRL